MPVLDARLEELEKEYENTFSAAEWTEDTDLSEESFREIGGGVVREIRMDLGTLGGSRPR